MRSLSDELSWGEVLVDIKNESCVSGDVTIVPWLWILQVQKKKSMWVEYNQVAAIKAAVS